MMRGIMRKMLWCGLLILGMRAARADEEPSQNFNLPLPTLGGMQFWADELILHEWRIQRNVLTDHYRLLDGADQRKAWGTFEQCRAALEKIKRQRNLPPLRGRAVILLHGLGGSRIFMKSMENYLRERGKLQVICLGYPSTQGSVGDHARTLARVIDRLEGIDEIDFVCHSLGNIVVRRYLQDMKEREIKSQSRDRNATATSILEEDKSIFIAQKWGPSPKPRFRRMVMIGPPNHGSTLAMLVPEVKLLQSVGGKSAAELGGNWNRLQGKLATPEFEFAVIAGGKSNGRGYNPLMPGDNDGLVAVEDARLVGARDWTVVPVMHAFLPHDPQVQEQTLRFLQYGFLRSEKQRRPIRQIK
jgi:pimeloyl-ACP methyl ester carboxylesterase